MAQPLREHILGCIERHAWHSTFIEGRGVADGASAVFKFTSGYFSDRIRRRKSVATAGYAVTAAGLGLLRAVTTWPQVLLGRGVAWIGRGSRQPIRAAMLAGSVENEDLGKAFGFHQAMDTVGAVIGPAVAFLLWSLASAAMGLVCSVATFHRMPAQPSGLMTE